MKDKKWFDIVSRLECGEQLNVAPCYTEDGRKLCGCDGCCFGDYDCTGIECRVQLRADNTDVVFVLTDKNGKRLNPDKVYAREREDEEEAA